MLHQYIIRRKDGWYVIRNRGFGEEAFGPFLWYWLACLASCF